MRGLFPITAPGNVKGGQQKPVLGNLPLPAR